MRTFTFSKECISLFCDCICIRRSLIHRTNNNNNLDSSSHCNKAVEFCENGQTINRTMEANDKEISSSGSGNSSADDTDETLPLRPETIYAHETLNLKHSACLFCLGNHPKSIVSSKLCSKSLEALNVITDEERESAAVSESISTDLLKLIDDKGQNSTEDTKNSDHFDLSESFLLIVPQSDKNRRNSIHLSLEKLEMENSCLCLHHSEEQATRC